MNTKEKILQYLNFKEISQGRFCRKIGVSNGFLSSGKHIGSEKLKVIRDNFLDLNMNWLIYDEGKMIIESNILNERTQEYLKSAVLDAKTNKIIKDNNLKELFELLLEEYKIVRKKQIETEKTLSNLVISLNTLKKNK